MTRTSWRVTFVNNIIKRVDGFNLKYFDVDQEGGSTGSSQFTKFFNKLPSTVVDRPIQLICMYDIYLLYINRQIQKT